MTQLSVLGRLVFKGAVAGVLAGGWLFASAEPAQAVVFNYPEFVTPGGFGIGLAPELVLSSGAGVGINARYTHGINDLLNASATVGTGGGPRQFRVGGAAVFDFFPDIDKQPGIGVAMQGLFVRVPTPGRAQGSEEMTGQLEITAIPYLHKTFTSGTNEFSPFLGVPFGMSFQSGQYKALSTVVLGSSFKLTPQLSSTVEFGIAVNHTESYLAAGVTYYH